MPSNLVRPRVLAVIVFAAFIVARAGCSSGTNPTRWEQLCSELHDLKYLQRVANKVGAEASSVRARDGSSGAGRAGRR